MAIFFFGLLHVSLFACHVFPPSAPAADLRTVLQIPPGQEERGSKQTVPGVWRRILQGRHRPTAQGEANTEPNFYRQMGRPSSLLQCDTEEV